MDQGQGERDPERAGTDVIPSAARNPLNQVSTFHPRLWQGIPLRFAPFGMTWIPNDPERQKRVLRAALRLLRDPSAGPRTIADYEESVH